MSFPTVRFLKLGIPAMLALCGCKKLLEDQAKEDMQSIERQVAENAVKEYGIVNRNGTAMDRCVHAGLVSAAWVQAKDESNYARWKAIETADCKAAGMPQ